MAIIKGAALANANENFAIVDSHNSHGGFKNHVADLSAFTSFSDLYVDVPNSSADWTGGDAWGLYKPWATMIYVEDVNPLIEVTDISGLELGVNYFDISTDGSGVFYGPSGEAPVPGFLVYNGNSSSEDQNWNGSYVKQFTITDVDGVNQASPTYWVDIKTIVTDVTLSGGSDVVITDNVVDPINALTDVVLGNVTEETVNEEYSVNFGTGLDILNLIDSTTEAATGFVIAEEVLVEGEPKIRFKTNKRSVLGTVNQFQVGDSFGGILADEDGDSQGDFTVYGNVSINPHLNQTAANQPPISSGTFTSSVPSFFTNSIALNSAVLASGITIYSDPDTATLSTSNDVVVKKPQPEAVG